jgi:hypothetical protein
MQAVAENFSSATGKSTPNVAETISRFWELLFVLASHSDACEQHCDAASRRREN